MVHVTEINRRAAERSSGAARSKNRAASGASRPENRAASGASRPENHATSGASRPENRAASGASRPEKRGLPSGPFLKWAGGKRQLLPELMHRVPDLAGGRYHEPFVGGGALYFALHDRGRVGRKGARLSDINAELINAYTVVRDHVEPLITMLSRHKNDEDHFYEVRALDPHKLDTVERAARLIYLNKTCFNGLFRENQRGGFNVPFGRYARPRFCAVENLRAASHALRGVCIEVAPFEQSIRATRRGDFIYFDPPYVPVSRTSSFVNYSSGGFGEPAHMRLALVAASLAERGVNVLLSNSMAPIVQQLYGAFRMEEVLASRAINSRADRRGKVSELLIAAGPHVGISTAAPGTSGRRSRLKANPVAPQGLEPRTLRV